MKIFKGPSSSILSTNSTDMYHGEDGLGGAAHLFKDDYKNKIEEDNAIEALIKYSKKFEGKLTVLCLGPVTNLAMAQIMDTNFLGRLEHLYILGGNISGQGNSTPTGEFNFLHDPEAVHVVLTSTRCPITIVPWEPIRKHVFDWVCY